MSTPTAWTPEMRDCFNLLKPAALIVVASESPIAAHVLAPASGETVRSYGRNRGVWPVRLVASSSLRDTATPTYNKDPFVAIRAQHRVWFLDEVRRDRALAAVADLIAARAAAARATDALLNGFLDLTPDVDLDLFCLEVEDVGRRVAGQCWNDDGLTGFVRAVAAEVDRLRRAHKLRAQTLARACEAVAVKLAEGG